jgi:signal transduction histidine kinase
MSDSLAAHTAEGPADPGLRESQLLLMHATDQLIVDRSTTLAETLQFIVSRTREILSAHRVDILFEYPDGLRVEVSSDAGATGWFVPLDGSISGLALSRRAPIVVNDLQSDPLLREKYFPRAENDPSALPFSILADELTLFEEPVGVIYIEASQGGRFADSHLDFVKAVAYQVSVAITHAALFDEDIFQAVTDRLLVEGPASDSEMISRLVYEHILSTLSLLAFVRPDGADILLADPQDQDHLVVACSTNNADIGVRVDIGSSICGEAFRENKTIMLPRAFEHAEYRPLVEGMRCEMAIPITSGTINQFPIGVLNLESARENAFSTVGRVLAERFGRRISSAVAMAKVRVDVATELQDQFIVLASDQVLNAVHRINNNVGSIRALVRDLLEDLESPTPPDPDDVALRLRLIESDTEHALAIPGELFKRIATPQESADVNGQVAAGIAAVRIPGHIELVTELAPGLPEIACTALDLVIENLLLNAVKAMQDRPGRLQVRTWLDQRLPREPFVVISVSDTGIGMTEDELSRLFEPRRAGHKGGGLGFGMMWVRGWVRRAQGLIEVSSQPGVGTTVNIRFQIGGR